VIINHNNVSKHQTHKFVRETIALATHTTNFRLSTQLNEAGVAVLLIISISKAVFTVDHLWN